LAPLELNARIVRSSAWHVIIFPESRMLKGVDNDPQPDHVPA